MPVKKVIRGKNCSLVRFGNNDEKLVELIHKLFNEKETEEYLNPEYLNYRTKPKIRKWIRSKTENPAEIWYIIKWKGRYIGYVCYKWRMHYDEACEISTAIESSFRGLRLGYESSLILIDEILRLGRFKYIVGYVHKDNLKAMNNLRKIGFRKASRLGRTVTMQFYNDDGTSCASRKYILFAIYCKSKNN